MTERIDHAKEAGRHLRFLAENLRTEELAFADLNAKEAQVHATLALFEQQRIANLIALGEATFPDGSRIYSRAVVELGEQVESYGLRAEVREGLGL